MDFIDRTFVLKKLLRKIIGISLNSPN